MNLGLNIGLGVGFGCLLILVIVVILLKSKKKEKNPLISRSKDTIVMINQRILSINSRIQKFDEEITKLVAAKEEGHISLSDNSISFDDIPHEIETKKISINGYIADIKDLEDYKREIEEILLKKDENKWNELEALLSQTKEKMKYRFI
ncbi:MAG: hypothetical protein GPJ51_01930 [Candidatus Heimdallarchaeota archaeon]|nr:hypothetical protein [Candidatus Heimdallarchaeota archaeon]